MTSFAPRLVPGVTIVALIGLWMASCSAEPEVPTSASGATTGGVTTGGGGATTGGGEGGTTTSSGTATSGTGGQGGEGGTICPGGTIVCEGSIKKVCDGQGGFVDVVDCAPQACAPGVGCAVCVPGEGTCSGNTSTVCNVLGNGYETYECDPDQGVTCDPGNGHCVGACSPETLGQSFIGCDYYPTVTANVVSEDPFHFAVVVSNTTASPATVKITQGAAMITSAIVAANDVAVITLPWVTALKSANGYSASILVADGAYRLRSDQPVTVYQYNPLEYTLGGQFTYTNDASLLLPVNTWTGNYRVAARQTLSTGLPGFYAVTASQDGTTVTLTPPAAGGSVAPGAGVAANGAGTVVMNAGDVLEVFTGGSASPGDVTGTLVAADKPVQIIGGHVCTYMPDPVCCCDHLEETIPPLETLSPNYIVTAPVVFAGGAPVANVVRIVATADATSLTYDPPQPGAPAVIPLAGGHVEIVGTTADFEVVASAKIIVVQYMVGGQNVGSGDPAMTLAVAKQQYRSSYLFHAPTNYTANFVNVVALAGANVMLDGVAVGDFSPIGATGYSVARVPLSNAGTGTHSISAGSSFGISVYGYGEYTSFWYPGGQNLEHL